MKTLLQKVQEPEYKDIRPFVIHAMERSLLPSSAIWLLYSDLHNHLSLTHIEEAREKLYKCLRQADQLLDWIKENRNE